jgi:3-deoxy-D-manno-octulosonic-acid transferase
MNLNRRRSRFPSFSPSPSPPPHIPLPVRAFYCLYDILIALCWPCLFVYYYVRSHCDGKYRTNYRWRLGLELPPDLPASRRIWFHALSVGETLSIVPLVKMLKEQAPGLEIVFSTKTETAQAIARSRLSAYAGCFFYLPLDLPLVMNFFVEHLKPDIFVLVETEIWPNLLRCLKHKGIFTVLVNGRISGRSFRRFQTFLPFVQPLFGCFDAVFSQTHEDKLRYESLGVSQDRVRSIGNLKIDSSLETVPEARVVLIRESAGIDSHRLVWIAGSTHAGEEEVLLATHKSLRRLYPDLLFILAPRNILRAPEIASLCNDLGLTMVSRSQGPSAREKAVLLLDTMGELSDFYALADAAFIGGSLVPFGGHNPLEAVAKLKPAVWGPYLTNFREIEESLLEAEVGRQVASGEALEAVLKQWLGEPGTRQHISDKAKRFLMSQSGSAEKIAGFILDALCRI